MHHFEIVNAKEETDPPGKLVSDYRRLIVAIGAREQNAGAPADRPNNHPAFRATVVRQRRSVLHELELQDIDKEIDRRLVLSHNQGDEIEVRHQLRPATRIWFNTLLPASRFTPFA
jgi:hypothetical protein